MKKAAIYCRLSDEDKNKQNKNDDSESIQNQKNMLMKYAMERDWDIFKIYSDDDWSGLDSNRPEFNAMLNDAESGKFDIILCKTQSRFTRDMELIEKYLHGKFLEWNVRFVGMVDNVDTDIKGNKKSRQINGLINEWYCEDVSESIKAVFDTKRYEGKFIGSFAPYGYKKDDKQKGRLVVDQEAAEIIRLIFEWYIKGHGAQHIAKMLNEMQIPNPTRYKQLNGMKYVNSSQKDNFGLWNKTTIKRILKHEVYIGNMVQGRRKKVSYKSKKIASVPKDEWIIVKDTHEAIVDKHTFNIAQKNLKQRVRSSGTGIPHLFAGKVKCLDCGNTMVKTKASNGYEYLRCKLYARHPGNKICTSHSIRLDGLENGITNRIKELINMLENEDYIIQRVLEDNDKDSNLKSLIKKLNKVKSDIDEKTHLIKNLYTDKVKGVITNEIFSDVIREVAEEKQSLELQKESLEKSLGMLEKKDSDIEHWINKLNEFKNFDKLTHTIVNQLIDYIEIGEKNKQTKEQKIKIKWLI